MGEEPRRPAGFRYALGQSSEAAGDQEFLPVRFNTVCRTFDNLRARMEDMRGNKELLCVTYGIPSSIHYPDRGWFDGGPSLRQLGARFARSGVTIYTIDPGLNLDRGLLNRDALNTLTSATGGRAFAAIDLARAISHARADAKVNYTLEYQPSARNWDGTYHKVKVIYGREDVHIRSKSGYFAELLP